MGSVGRFYALGFALLLAAACDAPAPEADVGESGTTGASVAEDDLLSQARAQYREGRLPSDLERALLESDADEHARARRLLEAIRHEGPIAPPAQGEAAEPAQGPTLSPSTPVTEDPAPEGAATPTPNPAPSGESETAQQGALALVTRLELQKAGKGVELRLVAAEGITMTSAEQAGSTTVRLIARSAGALPPALQARPEVSGVKVADVRRGEGMLLISVEIPSGWAVGDAVKEKRGASVRFSPP